MRPEWLLTSFCIGTRSYYLLVYKFLRIELNSIIFISTTLTHVFCSLRHYLHNYDHYPAVRVLLAFHFDEMCKMVGIRCK